MEGRDAEGVKEFSLSLGNRGGVNEVSDWAEERVVALAEVEFHFHFLFLFWFLSFGFLPFDVQTFLYLRKMQRQFFEKKKNKYCEKALHTFATNASAVLLAFTA